MDSAIALKDQRSSPSLRAPWFLPLVVLFCGLAATALATYFVQQNIEAKSDQRFTEAISHVEETIRTRMESYIGLLRGGAGLFAANPFVTLEQFRNFHERLQIPTFYPGMQGYGYSARFPSNRLEAITQMVRQQGLTNFQVWPPDPRAEYHAIVFLEPQDERNRKALGFDMFTHPVRRAAMEKARDSGSAIASGKVTLVEEMDRPAQNGFLIYLPVYLGGAVPRAIRERRDQLQGFVYSPFRTQDLMRGIFRDTPHREIHFALYDGPEAAENLLFSTPQLPAPGDLIRRSQIEIAARPWTIVYGAVPAFTSAPGSQLLYIIPALGLLGSLLLFFLTRSQARARRGLEISASELAGQREWLQVTLSSIGDAVVTTDPRGNIRFMNSVAEQLTGWTLADARAKPLREVFDIINEETRQVLGSPAERVVREGKVVNLASHTLLIAKDGAERCIDDSAAPIRDAGKNIVGVVLVFHEITERRRYERRITAQHAVTSILAEAPALDVAAGRLLEAICEHLRFDLGVLWTFDPVAGHGSANKIWHLPNLPLDGFDQACLGFKPSPGEGLPGIVWESGNLAWAADLALEPKFPRAEDARKCGLRSALAFPVRTDQEIFGALEFFSREVQKPDFELQQIVRGLGAQIGQFIERKKAEQALQESEELYRAISETAADGIITIDEHSKILTINPAVEQIFGYSREELLGQNLTLLMPARLHAAHFAGVQRFISTGQKRISWHGVEFPGLRKDGQEVSLEMSFGVTKKGGQYLFTGLIRDISRRKEAEQKLREAEERFSLLVRRAEEMAFVIMDAEGRISHWNPGAERLFGYSTGEVMGRSARLIFTPEDRDAGAPEQEMKTAASHGEAADERWHIRKNGGRFWASGALICLRAPDGALRGYAKILRDMTHRKKAEEAVRELNQELEARVQRRTAALQENKEQLEAFTYTVAHDLRAPLRAMQGFSQTLRDDYSAKLGPDAHDYLERIMGAAQKMDTLIQDLLDYSQLSRSDLQFNRVSVSDSVQNALAAHQHEIEQRQARVETNIDQLFVSAHAATLQHAVSNLISNALKFVPPGQTPALRIRAIDQGSYVQISVQDNGIGIAPEHQHRIFRVFERLHGQEEYPGTGIGLAMVKTGIERMGGRVGLASAPGEGSLFWIELPKA